MLGWVFGVVIILYSLEEVGIEIPQEGGRKAWLVVAREHFEAPAVVCTSTVAMLLKAPAGPRVTVMPVTVSVPVLVTKLNLSISVVLAAGLAAGLIAIVTADQGSLAVKLKALGFSDAAADSLRPEPTCLWLK